MHILPFTAGVIPAGNSGGFTILRFSPVPAAGLVHLAGPGGGICVYSTAAGRAYTETFARLRALALPPHESAQKLRQTARS